MVNLHKASSNRLPVAANDPTHPTCEIPVRLRLGGGWVTETELLLPTGHLPLQRHLVIHGIREDDKGLSCPY